VDDEREDARVDTKTLPEAGDRSDYETGIENMPGLRRFLRGLEALGKLQRDPNDTEQALRAAVTLNAGRLRALVAEFEAQPEGRELLRMRPAIDVEQVDLDALAALPEGTLGRSYAEFLRARGLTPEVFVAPRELHDERMRYVAQRLRQTHDLWHVLTGYDTDVVGEVELQAFSYAQLRTPFALLVATLGIARSGARWKMAVTRVWNAYRRGRRTAPLGWRRWELLFGTPLDELRHALRL
jgi:ubiquinone biosynthesis protein COQ4